ncbi:glycosyltransferase family 71 protein [Xylaria sp. CBS 124048]|nr:glycosyltransferase family 71 protein [Xylaria sp. CBS 124048]
MLFAKPSSFGPKEGRFPPGLLLPSSPDRRHRHSRRQRQILVFVVVAIIILAYSGFFRSGSLNQLERDELRSPGLQGGRSTTTLSQTQTQTQTSHPEDPPIVENAALNELHSTTTENLIQPVTKSPGQMSIPKDIKKQDGDIPQPQQKLELKKEKAYSARPHLKRDLEAVFALMPDEISMRELLRPIDDGGAPRMRELGLRTRQYQKYFRAWENLHLVQDKDTGETYIRDDVIQYLRSKQDTSTSTSDDDDASDSTSIGMSLTDTIHSYETFRAFLTRFAELLFPWTSPYFADHMTLHAQFKNAGRGIVLTAGDGQAHYLLTTIYALRKIGCELPIEIMYLGESDLGEDHRVELESLSGVTTRDIAQMVDDRGWTLAGWAIKPFAILLSSFREVIFIDADSFFFRDPARLFEDPGYRETGALFFRDRTIMPESKRRMLLQILPRPIDELAKESTWWKGTSGHHQESGVVVVDKWKHFVSMLLICRFNGSDRDARAGRTGVYEMMHGDKETFWIGFLLAGDPSFSFHRGAVGIIGVVQSPNSTPIMTTTTTTETETSSSSTSETESPSAVNDSPLPEAEKSEDADNTKKTEKTNEATEKSEDVAKRELPEEHQTNLPRNDDDTKPPDNYTICSPQLLHLDLDDTPLWFNGWLLVSKYAEASNRKFAPMESYLLEPLPLSSSLSSSHISQNNDDDHDHDNDNEKGKDKDKEDNMHLRKTSHTDFWKLGLDNMCCLTSDKERLFEVQAGDLKLLEMMRERALEMGVMN